MEPAFPCQASAFVLNTPVVSENTIAAADLVPPMYQTCGKWWRHSAFEFSDTTTYTNAETARENENGVNRRSVSSRTKRNCSPARALVEALTA
jgi:hypothetical protein